LKGDHIIKLIRVWVQTRHYKKTKLIKPTIYSTVIEVPEGRNERNVAHDYMTYGEAFINVWDIEDWGYEVVGMILNKMEN
jgi:hypothetical protein